MVQATSHAGRSYQKQPHHSEGSQASKDGPHVLDCAIGGVALDGQVRNVSHHLWPAAKQAMYSSARPLCVTSTFISDSYANVNGRRARRTNADPTKTSSKLRARTQIPLARSPPSTSNPLTAISLKAYPSSSSHPDKYITPVWTHMRRCSTACSS